MEEQKEQQKLYGFLQMSVYFFVLLDIVIHVYLKSGMFGAFSIPLERLGTTFLFNQLLYTKLFTLLIVCLVGIGTLARKNLEADPKKHVAIPLAIGLMLLFSSIFFLNKSNNVYSNIIFPHTDSYQLIYILFSFFGTVLTLTAVDNISKFIRSGFGKDKWNVEAESFMQDTKALVSPTSISIPMLFYYKKKVHNGFININPFRGVMVLGTPGSGKSFGVINPAIRQLLGKDFTMCLYDFKFPDLAKIAYYHYLMAKQEGRMKNYKFHVINLNDVTKSNRVNPLNPAYVRTLAEAQEISTALVEALKKGDKSGGSDQFFTQSAINFLACAVYFLAKYENGKYSSMPHLMALLNRSYSDIFTALLTNPELPSLLSPFMSAYEKKAFDQLEGQIGTLKIFISRLATKESFWVFAKDDFNLKISDPKNPSILVLANDPMTQDINSALYALIVNRLVSLINSKGNHPTCIIADEAPTLYIHRVENLIATARSNKVGVIMGLQELPQFKQQYGEKTAETISAIIGNILSGSVRNKQTLEWLQTMFGKVKQTGESLNIDRSKTSVNLNERLDSLIPAGKIASLQTSEMVGLVARDVNNSEKFTGEYVSSAVHCKINLDMAAINKEERNYPELPTYYNFKGKMEEKLFTNYIRITTDIAFVIERIKLGEEV
ncbi:MAG: TraM recognition domain-containing protein [Olivibacter sp.]|nr:TraM recognition domain-containing protein [Olivibacter sp. UJ_SKK_5.1]